jgi:phosphoglucosamine mutase
VTPEVALALGRAAAAVLGGGQWVIGADTRASSPMLVAALAAGLASAGADVVDMAVVPTPAVAHLASVLRCPAAVVSASHNPWTDNGIKLLASGGRKLSDDVEAAVAENMTAPPPGGARVGSISRHPAPLEAYARHVIGALDGRRLDGWSVVVDCANGAGSVVAPAVLRDLGATVSVLAAEPNGTNINDGCGSTYPAALQRAVVDAGADAGLALDGDADRVLAVGGDGTLVDGDRIIAICATDLWRRGRLPGGRVAVTVMSNLGLRRALADAGIGVVETPVGDRNLLAAMAAEGIVLGGEQSGHVIFADLATTGDGLMTGVLLLDAVRRSGQTVAAAAAGAMHQFPQVLRNVEAARAAVAAPSVVAAVGAATAELGASGRVLVRPSGTEPVVRVMVEAEALATAEEVADRIVAAIRAAAV